MPVQYSIVFDEKKCIQCFGCEVACKNWRGVELGVKWRHVYNIWHGHYPTLSSSSASVSCMHCLDPACVKACPEGAITKRANDGVVVVDQSKCIGCEACLEACPLDIPQFGSDGTMQKCDLCVNEIDYKKELPPCVETCPTHALVFKMVNKEEKIRAEQNFIRLKNYNYIGDGLVSAQTLKAR